MFEELSAFPLAIMMDAWSNTLCSHSQKKQLDQKFDDMRRELEELRRLTGRGGPIQQYQMGGHGMGAEGGPSRGPGGMRPMTGGGMPTPMPGHMYPLQPGDHYTSVQQTCYVPIGPSGRPMQGGFGPSILPGMAGMRCARARVLACDGPDIISCVHVFIPIAAWRGPFNA